MVGLLEVVASRLYLGAKRISVNMERVLFIEVWRGLRAADGGNGEGGKEHRRVGSKSQSLSAYPPRLWERTQCLQHVGEEALFRASWQEATWMEETSPRK